MLRKNFYDIIKNSEIDVRIEYERIYNLFHSTDYGQFSIYDTIDDVFLNFPKSFRGRTISLDDFNKTYKFYFTNFSKMITEEEVISYCEYVKNLCNQLMIHCRQELNNDDIELLELLYKVIESCMDELGLVAIEKNGIIIYVEKNPAAMSVAEIMPDEMMFSVLEYNHYRLKGDLVKKREILRNMADDIEDKSIRNALKNINSTLEKQLYQLMNKFVRHAHTETPYIVSMKSEDIEDVYDEIYQMWLLAKLELNNLERKEHMKVLLEKINQ